MTKELIDAAILDEDDICWFREQLLGWAQHELRNFPWRETSDPYAIFIAEFLLQQTDAPRVLPVYQRFMTQYPDLKSFIHADLLSLVELLQPLGFHFRAIRLFDIASALKNMPEEQISIPGTEELLLQLPGVGRYMARSICANAFGKPTAVVDTNIIRIFNRFFNINSSYARPRNDPSFWEIAQTIAPDSNVGLWNLTLIDFGAAVCKARKPKCTDCILRARCYHALHSPECGSQPDSNTT